MSRSPSSNVAERRHRARAWRIALLVGAALVALVLGYIGYRAMPGEQTHTDSLYRALRLFQLDADVSAGQVPWELEIARFLAPLVVVYAALAAVVLLLREQIEGFMVSHTARDHVVVLGTGQIADALVEGLRLDHVDVVAVDDGVGTARPRALRAVGAHVVLGDPTRPSSSRAARVPAARHVIILGASDDRNLHALAAATSTLTGNPDRRPDFHVAISDVETWKELSREALTIDGARGRTEFFNLPDRTARRLVDHALQVAGDAVLNRCVVDGSGAIATRTVSHLVRRAIASDVQARLLVPASTSGRLLAELEQTEPWCLDAADIELAEEDELQQAEVALVCGDEDDPVQLARALRRAHGAGETTVFAATLSPHTITPDQLAGISGDGVAVVSPNAADLARELFDYSAVEVLARARHEDYVRRERHRGVTPAQNPSLISWEELPTALKESNRRFAESVGRMIGELGAYVRPLAGAPVLDDLALPPAVLERLAEGEHHRWAASLRRDGWRPTAGAKDPAAKLHPLLVPWSELAEAEREKDRDVFRDISRILSAIGYEVVMPTQTAEPPDFPHVASREPLAAGLVGDVAADGPR